MRTKLYGKPAFTLIESLTVVMIIGILVSLATYLITQAQRQARDAVRKSDVSAIAQGFEARYLDKTCLNQSEVGFYPGIELIPATGRMPWTKVESLSDQGIDSCNPFSTYLSIIPQDPKTAENDYYFNLSTGATKGKHYRVAAMLEKNPSDEQWDEICRLSNVWYEDFGGTRYAGPATGCGGTIGQAKSSSLFAGLFNWLGIARALTPPPQGTITCPPGQIPDPNNPNSCIPDTGGNPGNPPPGGGDPPGGGGTIPCEATGIEGEPGGGCQCPDGYEPDPNNPGFCTESGGGGGGGSEEEEEFPYNYYIGR